MSCSRRRARSPAAIRRRLGAFAPQQWPGGSPTASRAHRAAETAAADATAAAAEPAADATDTATAAQPAPRRRARAPGGRRDGNLLAGAEAADDCARAVARHPGHD